MKNDYYKSCNIANTCTSHFLCSIFHDVLWNGRHFIVLYYFYRKHVEIKETPKYSTSILVIAYRSNGNPQVFTSILVLLLCMYL